MFISLAISFDFFPALSLGHHLSAIDFVGEGINRAESQRQRRNEGQTCRAQYYLLKHFGSSQIAQSKAHRVFQKVGFAGRSLHGDSEFEHQLAGNS